MEPIAHVAKHAANLDKSGLPLGWQQGRESCALARRKTGAWSMHKPTLSLLAASRRYWCRLFTRAQSTKERTAPDWAGAVCLWF